MLDAQAAPNFCFCVRRLASDVQPGHSGYLIRALCLTISLLLSPLTQAADTDTEAKLEQLKSRINKLEQWIGQAQGKRSSVQQALRKTELAIGGVAKQIRTIGGDITQGRQQLQQLTQKEQKLHTQLKQQADFLSQQIRAAYSIGRQEYLKVLLNQEQPAQLARVMTYYDYFNRARTDQIEQYQGTLATLLNTRQAILAQQQALAQAQQKLEQQRQQLIAQKQQRRTILLKLKSSIKAKGGELEQLLSDRKRLEQLLQAVEQTIADLALPDSAKPITAAKGQLPWPVSGKLLHRFGSVDPVSKVRWNGMLIQAQEGHDIKAVHYGRVVFADWLRGFGLLVILDHGDGYMSLYGHNQTLYAEKGDWVASGDTIASAGNSGGTEQTGLYFEIRKNGQPQNPQRWILARR